MLGTAANGVTGAVQNAVGILAYVDVNQRKNGKPEYTRNEMDVNQRGN